MSMSMSMWVPLPAPAQVLVLVLAPMPMPKSKSAQVLTQTQPLIQVQLQAQLHCYTQMHWCAALPPCPIATIRSHPFPKKATSNCWCVSTGTPTAAWVWVVVGSASMHPIGAPIALRLRSNSGFHPPAPEQPMLLIGNGTGIAGLRAHLRARIAAGARRNWLLFGERNAAHDALYADELQQWQRDGWLERLDLAYSRDQQQSVRYVQHALAASADHLRLWVDQGACIYVCGSLRGMAPEVDQTLESILGTDVRQDLLRKGRYRRDVY